MAIETICSGCGKRLAVGDEYAGRRARCPACGQIYTVPGLGAPIDLPEAVPMPSAAGSTSRPEIGPIPGSSALGSGESTAAPGDSMQTGRYWMKSPGGQEFGPVDRGTLNRWFIEGRVGPGYQIRVSEFGDWMPAAQFSPANQSAGSLADQPYAPTVGAGTFRQWPKADNSGVVLAMGILSWVVCMVCPFPIFGIIAWVMGNQALNDIHNELADPTNRGMVQVGYYLGMANVLLIAGLIALSLVAMVFAGIADALN